MELFKISTSIWQLDFKNNIIGKTYLIKFLDIDIDQYFELKKADSCICNLKYIM